MDADVQTFVNGVEFPRYDEFKVLLKEMEQYYISQKDYKGYPRLWDKFHRISEVYNAAGEEERKWMFSLLFSFFTTALSHWKTDIDRLYTEEGRRKHQEFMEQLKLMLPYMGEANSFNIGI